jgi:hypothetical protein
MNLGVVKRLTIENSLPIGTPGISPKNLSLLNASPFPVPNAEPSPVRQPEFGALRLSYLISHHAEDGMGRGGWRISRSRATTTNPPSFKISALNHPAFCPANDRETSRNDGNGWSIESAGV